MSEGPMKTSGFTKMQIERTSRPRSAQTFFLLVFMFIAGATIAVHSSRVGAQSTTTVKPSNGDDLRAVFVPAADIAEGKVVADTTCAGCHGVNGISAIAGVPHLAGQRAAYLHIELKAYQSGIRGDNAMRNSVKFLNDDALVKVAAYFASLDPAQPGTTNGPKAPPADPVQAGK